jgi:hypothetical protein
VVSERTTVWGGAARLLPAAVAAPARILAGERGSAFASALAAVAAFFPVLSTNSTVLAFRVVPAVFRWERLSTQNPIILKENFMNKLLAALVAGFFAVGAFAQAAAPAAPAAAAAPAAKKEEKKAAVAAKKDEKKAAATTKKEEAKK